MYRKAACTFFPFSVATVALMLCIGGVAKAENFPLAFAGGESLAMNFSGADDAAGWDSISPDYLNSQSDDLVSGDLSGFSSDAGLSRSGFSGRQLSMFSGHGPVASDTSVVASRSHRATKAPSEIPPFMTAVGLLAVASAFGVVWGVARGR